MNMKIGSNIHRRITDKLKLKLGDLLAEHALKSNESTHRILLGDLIKLVEEHNNKTDVPWYNGDL